MASSTKVMQLVKARNNAESISIKEVFDEQEVAILKKLSKKLEGKTELLKNDNPEDKLSFASWVIARLGGWKGYKKRRPPGPITMKRGLEKFATYMEIIKEFQ